MAKAVKDNEVFQNIKNRVEEIEKKEQEIKRLEMQLALMIEQSNDQLIMQSKLQLEKGILSNMSTGNSLMQNSEYQKIAKIKG